jgi:hypothetical protein
MTPHERTMLVMTLGGIAACVRSLEAEFNFDAITSEDARELDRIYMELLRLSNYANGCERRPAVGAYNFAELDRADEAREMARWDEYEARRAKEGK